MLNLQNNKNNVRLSFKVQWNDFNFTLNCVYSGIRSCDPYKKEFKRLVHIFPTGMAHPNSKGNWTIGDLLD